MAMSTIHMAGARAGLEAAEAALRAARCEVWTGGAAQGYEAWRGTAQKMAAHVSGGLEAVGAIAAELAELGWGTGR